MSTRDERNETAWVDGYAVRLIPRHELTFVLTAWKDYPGVRATLSSIRSFYPDAEVIVITDGDANPQYLLLLSDPNVRLVQGDRLDPERNGGAWWDRVLRWFLLGNARFLVQLDPGAMLQRPLRHAPLSGDTFGVLREEVENNEWRARLEGACVGMTRDAALRLVNSRILLQTRYRATSHELAGCETPQHCERDWALADVHRRLEMTMVDWPEVGRFGEGFAVVLPNRAAESLVVPRQSMTYEKSTAADRDVSESP